MTWIDQVRRARRARGMSLRAFSLLCEIDRSDLRRLERGEHSPTVATLQRMSNALGTPIVIEPEITRTNEGKGSP